MKRKTLDNYFYDGTFYPRAATVKLIARTLSQPAHIPVTAEDVLLRFGGRTHEDRQREEKQAVAASRPLCPICGRPIPRRLSSRASPNATDKDPCKVVHRIIRSGVETELGKWSFTIMAAGSSNAPADRVASLLREPTETVAGWLREWHVLVEKVHRAMKSSAPGPWSLMQATADALGIGPDALGILLHHRIRHYHSDRRRPIAPKYLQKATLTALAKAFNRTEDEILVASRRKTMSEFAKEHSPRASIQRFRLGKTKTRPLDPDTHKAAQLIFRKAWRGATRDEITHALEDAGLPDADNPMWFAKQHAASCRPCRSLAAAYLHVRQRETLDAIGQFFGGITPRHITNLVAKGKLHLTRPFPGPTSQSGI